MNGRRIGEDFSPGAVVRYECNDGFVMEAGQPERITCLDNGRWSHDGPGECTCNCLFLYVVGRGCEEGEKELRGRKGSVMGRERKGCGEGEEEFGEGEEGLWGGRGRNLERKRERGRVVQRRRKSCGEREEKFGCT